MKRNPFIKPEARIIRKVYWNSAVIRYRVKNKAYDSETGELSESEMMFERTVRIDNPSEFADALVDGENIKKGDLKCMVARRSLVDAINSKADNDPAVLSELRLPNATDGGIDTSTDRLVYLGREYSIRKIIPLEVYANEPALYRIHLREVK